MMPMATERSGVANPAGLSRRQLQHRDVAERLIAESLQDARLAAPYLCAQMSVSRTSLFRLFVHDGGVATFIRGRRIEAVHDTLMSDGHDLSVKELARSWHFSDAAHLTRLFKRRYGWPPKQYRSMVVYYGGIPPADSHPATAS